MIILEPNVAAHFAFAVPMGPAMHWSGLWDPALLAAHIVLVHANERFDVHGVVPSLHVFHAAHLDGINLLILFKINAPERVPVRRDGDTALVVPCTLPQQR